MKVRNFKNIFSFIALLIFAVLQSCDINEPVINNEISGKGTIKIVGDDFLLNTDTNLQYVIINLKDEFKVDSLRVEFRGIVYKNPNPDGIDKIELTHINKIFY
jgi:hypothetical protein